MPFLFSLFSKDFYFKGNQKLFFIKLYEQDSEIVAIMSKQVVTDSKVLY